MACDTEEAEEQLYVLPIPFTLHFFQYEKQGWRGGIKKVIPSALQHSASVPWDTHALISTCL